MEGSDALCHLVTPTAWTTLQKDGPNHLGLRYNDLPGHQIALITSGCVQVQMPSVIFSVTGGANAFKLRPLFQVLTANALQSLCRLQGGPGGCGGARR